MHLAFVVEASSAEGYLAPNEVPCSERRRGPE